MAASRFLEMTTKASQEKPLVLCVEDEEDILLMLKMMLEGRGYRVLTANNVETAVELATKHPAISTLITDYHIGRHTAKDLISALGKHKPKNVILVSGKFFAGDPKKEVPGIDAHLSKPFNLKKLIEKIDVEPNQSPKADLPR